MLIYLFYALAVLFVSTLLARIVNIKPAELVLCTGAVILNLIILINLIIQTGKFPVFNMFESFLMITFIMGFLGLISFFGNSGSSNIRLWVWVEVFLLFIIMFLFPKEPFTALYDSGYILIVLFHVFRCVSLALMLFASAWYIQFIIQRELDERTSLLAHQGRNYLVLSAVFFLSAEYVGIIWCQNGWGDFWMWSQNFFQSTIIVLYLMLAFHIPGKSRKSEDIRSIIGGLSGFFMLTLTVMRNMP